MFVILCVSASLVDSALICIPPGCGVSFSATKRKAGLFENLFIWIFFSASLKSLSLSGCAELRVCPAQTSLIPPKGKSNLEIIQLARLSLEYSGKEYSGFRGFSLELKRSDS